MITVQAAARGATAHVQSLMLAGEPLERVLDAARRRVERADAPTVPAPADVATMPSPRPARGVRRVALVIARALFAFATVGS